MTILQTAMAGRRGSGAMRVAGGHRPRRGLWPAVKRRASNDFYPTDYRERHPITVKEGTRTVEIFLGRNRGGLTPSQRADVLAFAQSWRRDATGGIIIDVPHGGPTDRAATDSMREVHSILAASGVPGRAVFMRSYRPAGNSLASIKVSYSKLTAEAGPCGLWPHDLGPSLDSVYNENRPHWNLGCASQRNLASMVDNPGRPGAAARRNARLQRPALDRHG